MTRPATGTWLPSRLPCEIQRKESCVWAATPAAACVRWDCCQDRNHHGWRWPEPIIKTPPYHTVHLAINLKCQIRLAAELLYKSLVMPVIVILFHCCNFFCKITAVSAAGQCVIAETDTSKRRSALNSALNSIYNSYFSMDLDTESTI